MNCVQCGDELPASAKFCKKCGCKVQLPEASKATPRGLPPAPTPAYTTCPDCGALCKHDARFCNKCGCRFEEAPSFEDTKRDLNTPLSKDEEKAILVFGNVQDSTSPAPENKGERIDTSPAMVIGGAVPGSPAAVPAPSLRPADAGNLLSKNTSSQPTNVNSVPAAAPHVASAKVSTSSAPAAPVVAPESAAKQVPRNPMPVPVPAAGGSGKWVALGVLALAALVGGGAWWWNTKDKSRIATSTPAQAPAATVASPPAVIVPPTAVPAESALTPNEAIAPATVESAPVAPVVAPPVVEPAPAAAPNAAPAPQEAAPTRPAPRKPVRKQTLDDLLN